MQPDTSTEQQGLPPDDAVAFISLDGATAAPLKAAALDVSLPAQQPYEEDNAVLQLPCDWHSDSGSPAVPFGVLGVGGTSAPPADPQDSSSTRPQSSTPADLQDSSSSRPQCSTPAELQDNSSSNSRPESSTPSWRHRVFKTGRATQEQQQQAAALPPGCLVLDGEALLWHDYEDPQQQQQQHAGFTQTLGSGLVGRAGSSDGVSDKQQSRLRSSVSTPNLVLLADGTQELQQEHQPQLQEQYHLQQQQQGRQQLQPVMHSSPSYDSLLSLSQTGQLSNPAVSGSVSMSASGAAPKSRLGRPTGDITQRQQQQQQQGSAAVLPQQQQQQQEGVQDAPQHYLQQDRQQQQSFQFNPVGPLPAEPLNTFGSNWDRIQQQQAQMQRLGGSPQPQQLRFASGPGSGSAPHVTSWNFERCNSGLSLGSDALGRKLRVHCLTFNMNGKLPASLPREMLGECGVLAGADAEGSPDLLVFATQENAYISEWEKLLSASLAPEGYERLAWHSLRAIHLVLFAGKRFRRQVLSIRGSSVATGIGNVVGNKGAVALSVELLDLKLLFISSHLAAHGDQVQRRNDDYQRIRAGLFATTTTTTPTPRATGDRSATGRSPRTRGSMDIPRSLPMSAPAARAATSDGGGKPLVEGIGALSGRTGSIPWGGFMRSNRVMDSSAYEEANRSPASAARKQVSWWAQQEPGDSSPSCSSPLLAQPSATSESILSQHTRGSPLAADSNKLRVASCPFMEQQQSALLGSSVGDSIYSSSCATLGAESPAWGGSLTPVDRTGSTSSSFLRTLVGKQSGKTSGRSGDALESHDVVFWLGDLNYRINGNSKAVRHLMRSRLHEVLHANDQLRLQQKMGTVFQGFQEGQIRFPPTFKFLPGSSAYSEKRVPSWTDRILWKVRSRQQPPLLPQQQQQLSSLPPPQQQPSSLQQQQQQLLQPQQQQQQQLMQTQPDESQMSWVSGDGSIGDSSMFVPPSVCQLYYTSVPEIITSDHKPVISGFVIAAVGEEDEEEEAAGLGDESSDDDDDDEGRNAKRSRCCMM